MSIIKSSLTIVFKPLLIVIGFILALFINIALPKRGKRILGAASLYVHMDNIDPVKLEEHKLGQYLNEVNSLLHLIGRNNDAIKMPMFIHNYIWGHLSVDDIQRLKSIPPDKACEELVAMMPWFLRYHRRVMREDIMIIVQRHLVESPKVQYI